MSLEESVKRLSVTEDELDSLARLVDLFKLIGYFKPPFVAKVHAARKRRVRCTSTEATS